MESHVMDAFRYAFNSKFWEEAVAKRVQENERLFAKMIEEGYIKGGTNMPKQAIYEELLEECKDTYVRKNKDYGDSVGRTYEEFGLVSFLVRMEDKMNRLKTLYKTEDDAQVDESIDDTLKDLANYTLLALVERIAERGECQGSPFDYPPYE